MLNTAYENEYRTYVFVILKTYPSLLNYFSAKSLAIVLKVSASERKLDFPFIKNVQISSCSFVCQREES